MRPPSRVSTPPDPLLGTQLGEFVIQERIGAGGMGVVYRAVHPLIGKQVAIKVMRIEMVSQQQVQRLLVEARAVNAVRHPGIIDIFGFGTLPDERPYVIMELLQGRSLSDFVRSKRPMDLESVVWVMDQMLSALGAAHRAGVVHRDLKPPNVFIVETPSTPAAVKLVDFGIAKLMESRDKPLTADDMVIGTPEFMAPEQIRGDTVGPATDLYAAGVLMFQLLTGVRPFQGESVQVMFAHLEQSPPLPSSRLPGLPHDVDALVLQLLAKSPASRPPSAEAVREQLKRIPLRAQPRAPSLTKTEVPLPAADNSHTPSTQEALKAIRQPPGIGWALLGTLVLLSVGAGVVRFRSVPPIVEEKLQTPPVQPVLDAGSMDPKEPEPKPPEPTPPEPKPPEPSAPLPAPKFSQQKKDLRQRIQRLRTELLRRSASKPEAAALKARLLNLERSIKYASTAKDYAAARAALDDWEDDLDQQFLPR
ncbi:serine/threonine-protein kinase [Corallococcus sp. AS-1-12]|uniref:serine/threonine-protein kinase n=1 Tax=Corallococcus sp. AS-1-12 TaxID=2874598 RepID=UPI001CC097E3|nr:serine/threonine-protein kinase [Corallococcus sp. AS-1-12]MBZ4333130.1 serine/threonine protein kinase [Corallococcus sp. AS-1-12]